MKIPDLKLKPVHSAGITAIAFLCVLFFFNPAFETNDDAVMAFISSGGFTGQPSHITLFTNILFGLLLKGLYTLTTTINWYPIVLLALHFFSVMQIRKVFFQITTSKLHALLFFIVLSLFEINLIINLQFASTALVLGISGIISLYAFILSNGSQKKLFYASLIFFSICAIVRYQCFICILLVGAPLYFMLFYNTPAMRKLIIYLFFILSPLIFQLINTQYYKHALGQPPYLAYQNASYNLINYDHNISQDMLAQSNLTENDYNLFKLFFWADSSVYTKENIIHLDKISHKKPACSTWAEKYKIILLSNVNTCAFALLLSLTCISFVPIRYKFFMVAFCVYVNALFIALCIFYKLPERIFLPVLFFYCLTVLFIYLFSPKQKRHTTIFFLILCCISIVPVIKNLIVVYNQSNMNSIDQDAFYRNLTYINNHPETIFISPACEIPLQQPNFFKPSPMYVHHNFIDGAGFINSPDYNKLLQLNAITNLTADIADKKIVFICAYPELYLYYKNFMAAHYNMTVSFEKYSQINDAFLVTMHPL